MIAMPPTDPNTAGNGSDFDEEEDSSSDIFAPCTLMAMETCSVGECVENLVVGSVVGLLVGSVVVKLVGRDEGRDMISEGAEEGSAVNLLTR